MNTIPPQLPFRSAFLAKLNLIRRVFGSAAKAAKRIGVTERHFFRWMADDNFVAPARRTAQKVDDAYFLAIEKRDARRRRKVAAPDEPVETFPCGQCQRQLPEGSTACHHCGASDEDE